MSIGKNRGESSAPTSAARYPAQSAWEVSASMDCAREIRGTSSSENAVMPALVAASIESTPVTGDKNEIVTAPFFKDEICAGVSEVTERTTSASLMTLPLLTVAPAAVNSSSVAWAWTPAPDSITTS